MAAIRAVVLISARLKSTRLPNKQMLEIEGRPITAHLMDRLKTAKRPVLVALATSTDPSDEPLEQLAHDEHIPVFRGSLDDKLDRYFQAAKHYTADLVVVVDGDDPFCDPDVIDRVIEAYEKTNADYLTVRDLPVGITCHGIKFDALRKVCELKADNDTELWGDYFTETGLFQVEELEAEPFYRRPTLRLTLDYKEDFRFFQAVFQRLYTPGRIFSLREVLTLLDKHPEIIDINKGAQTAYEANLERIRKVPTLRQPLPEGHPGS